MLKWVDGCEVILDAIDEPLFNRFQWKVQTKRNIRYIETFARKPNGKWGAIGFHRLLLGVTDPRLVVDHVNRNALDNRRVNLRVCSKSQNSMNRPKTKSNTSGFKGVSLNGRKKKFVAYITVNRKRIYLGYTFQTAEDAARTYDKAALEHFGAFAFLNFPEKT